MKVLKFGIIFFAFGMAIAVLFFLKIDSAMEIDNLKEHIKLQRNEMQFMESMVNGLISSCKMSVIEFEKLAHANGDNISWQGDDGLVRGFKVLKKDSCIVNIKIPDWL